MCTSFTKVFVCLPINWYCVSANRICYGLFVSSKNPMIRNNKLINYRLSILLLILGWLISNNVLSAQDIDARYLRLTETQIFIQNSDSRVNTMLSSAIKMNLESSKVNHFDLNTTVINASASSNIPFEIPYEKSNLVVNLLMKKKIEQARLQYSSLVMQNLGPSLNSIGQSYIGYWFNRNSTTGMMNEKRIFEMAEYAATAQDFYMDSITGKNKLHHLANNLLDNSYLIVFDVDNIKSFKDIYDAADIKNANAKQPTPPELRTKVGYRIALKIYQLKLGWDLDTSFYSFFEKYWIDGNDSAVKRRQKLNDFNQSHWSFNLVDSKNFILDQTEDFYNEYVETETKARNTTISNESKVSGMTPPIRKNKSITLKEYVDYGAIAFQNRLYYVAAENYENALKMSQNDSNIKKQLSLVYLQMGDREYQNKQYHYAKISWNKSQIYYSRNKVDFKSKIFQANSALAIVLQKIEVEKYNNAQLVRSILDRFPGAINASAAKNFKTNESIAQGLVVKTSIVGIEGTQLSVPIGTKEKIKRGSVFTMYEVVENDDKSKSLSSVGYCRVTRHIANNVGSNASSGNYSIFQQQSGRMATPGLILEQSKDRGWKLLFEYDGSVRSLNIGAAKLLGRDYYAGIQFNELYTTMSIQKEIFTKTSGFYWNPSVRYQTDEVDMFLGLGFGMGYNFGQRLGLIVNYSFDLPLTQVQVKSSNSFGFRYRI